MTLRAKRSRLRDTRRCAESPDAASGCGSANHHERGEEAPEGALRTYWRSVDTGVALGYWKGVKGGCWIARVLVGGRYREGKLGRAHDKLIDAGEATLDFRKAESAAKEWASRQFRAESAPPEPYTVALAVADYIEDYKTRGGRALRYVDTTFKAHVLPPLGDKLVADLTPTMLRDWHRKLANSPPRLRAKPGQAQKVRQLDAEDNDARRGRRATANSILTLAKAALNLAYREGRRRPTTHGAA